MAQLRFMNYSAAAALIAAVQKNRVLNFMSRETLLDWTANLREKGQRAA